MSEPNPCPEVNILNERHREELRILLQKKHTRRHLKRLATKHTNQIMRAVNRWAKKEARKK